MESWLDLLVCQAFEHQPYHTQIDPRLTGGRQEFIVFTHPAVAADPRNCALHDPPARKQVEARQPQRRFLAWRQPPTASTGPLHDRQAPAEGLPHPGLQWPEVGAVGPDQLQAWQRVCERQPSNTGWGTLYAVNGTPVDGAPGSMVTAGSVYISDGTSANRWRPLPMLLSGASGRVLGIGPNGLLVMELHDAAAPLAPDATALSPIVTLCAWDPSASRWLSPCLIEPANSSVVSVAWDEQSGAAAPQLVIWFMTRTDHLWQNITPAADWLPHGSL